MNESHKLYQTQRTPSRGIEGRPQRRGSRARRSRPGPARSLGPAARGGRAAGQRLPGRGCRGPADEAGPDGSRIEEDGGTGSGSAASSSPPGPVRTTVAGSGRARDGALHEGRLGDAAARPSARREGQAGPKQGPQAAGRPGREREDGASAGRSRRGHAARVDAKGKRRPLQRTRRAEGEEQGVGPRRPGRRSRAQPTGPSSTQGQKDAPRSQRSAGVAAWAPARAPDAPAPAVPGRLPPKA